MPRTLYRWLLRLHPAPFRRQFEDEMLAIFDEPGVRQNAPGLFRDAMGSLFRQWVLRAEFRRAVPASAGFTPAEAPLFASLDSYKMRPAAVLNGSLVSLALVCAVTVGIVRSGKAPAWSIGTHAATGALLPVSRASVAETEPNTLVRFGLEPDNPWRAVASVYFKSIRVLGALDANQDFVISPWEIITAPAALRKLDRNHDGKLSMEECGFNGPDEARPEFMSLNPVLAALDTDHDGEISADEIMNSAQALGKLDRNGDGFLTPDEVMPDSASLQAAAIFLRLDTNHDGRISAVERSSDDAEPLRGILESADRNHDGVTTLAELARELRIREEAGKENHGALKAAGTVPQVAGG